jgi:hypothetical protein
MQFPLDLTENNVRRLALGHPIQLKAGALKGSQHFVITHPMTHGRLSKATRLGKGARLTMTPAEVQQTAEAGGFGDLWNKIKSVGRFVKKVVQSQPYQEFVRPVAKELVSKVTAPAIAMLPEALQGPAQSAVQKASEVTQAFGLQELQGNSRSNPKMPKKRAGKPKPKPKPKASGGSFLVN